MSNEQKDHVKNPTQEEDEEPQQRGKAIVQSLQRSSLRTKTDKAIGLLAPVLDPVGKGLGTVLRPVGVGVETITKPVGNALGGITRPALGPIAGEKEERAEVIGGNNKDSYEHGKQGLGGRLQTSDNPLGLDQTGKWGFREE
jgi:hypothetical protein